MISNLSATMPVENSEDSAVGIVASFVFYKVSYIIS